MPERKLLVITNPAGGRGQARNALAALRATLPTGVFDVQVRETSAPGDACAFAAAVEEDQVLCVIGGDGTLHEVLNGLMRRATPPPPIALVPTGTGNVVAQELGIPDVGAAVAALCIGTAQPFDLLRHESAGVARYAASIAGWAGTAEINKTAERLRIAGSARYSLAALLHLVIHRTYPLRARLDGEVLETEAHLVIACNTRRTGTNMLIAPRNRPDDGRMDVVIVRRTGRRNLVELFRKVADGRHLDLPFVISRRVRELEVTLPGSTTVNLDGELFATGDQSTVRVVPAAIRFFTPPASVAASPPLESAR